MAMKNPYQQYKQNSVMTATPAELTFMLYSGAIKYATMAKMSMEDKNIQESNNSILKVQAIVNELNNTLDMKYEVSEQYRGLYTFLLEKLLDANIQKNPLIVEKEILPVLEGMRDNWKLAMEESKKQGLAAGEKASQELQAQGSQE